MFAVLTHIYNHDSWEKMFCGPFKALQSDSPTMLFNLSLEEPHQHRLISSIRREFPGSFIIVTPNKGRDIGGKLALIHFFIQARLKSDYLIVLHDKQSHHWFAGETWQRKLFSIIDSGTIEFILKQFQQN